VQPGFKQDPRKQAIRDISELKPWINPKQLTLNKLNDEKGDYEENPKITVGISGVCHGYGGAVARAVV
jgi:hypothetical protein